MTSAETVSVIMPVFNGAQHLGAAMRSVFTQSSPPLELVIVNDGSTDGSAAMIQSVIAESIPPCTVTVLERANVGQSAARNVGVAHSSGTLLAFLDQDDLWQTQHLEVLTAGFDRNEDLGWSYSDFDEIDSAGLIVTRSFIAFHKFRHPKTAIHQLLGEDNMVLPSASVIRRSAFEAVGGFDPRLRGYEDDDLFIRVFQAGWRSQFESRALTLFRVHGGSSSDNNSFRTSRMVFFDKLSAQFPDDYKLNRLYVSDVLAPRLVASTVAEYSTALRAKQYTEARAIADCISILLAACTRVSVRRRLGVALLKHPRLCELVLRFRQMLPRFLRPRISPALAVRE